MRRIGKRVGRPVITGAAALTAAVLVMLLAPFRGMAGAGAAELRFELPVDCDMQAVCSVQNYVDHDPGQGWADYTCGRLGYDGQDGTDIRVPDLPTMHAGVAVIAAAPGVVKATRDGMPDVSVRDVGREAIRGREAGNGVVVDHGDGWETQYSHLKRGSVVVRRGDRVATGQKLGEIGLSGNTEFPHVHFEVRYQGRELDPFVGLGGAVGGSFACGGDRAPLWSRAAQAQLPYEPTGPLIAGFAVEPADVEKARRGEYAATSLPAGAPVLVLWTEVFGTQAGDIQKLRIIGPDGAVLVSDEKTLRNARAVEFAFAGRKRPAAGWQPGVYTGTYELIRGGEQVVTLTRTVTIAG